jgi:putative transposase
MGCVDAWGMTAGPRWITCHSDNVLLVHVVWATARRAPVLASSADAWLADVLRRKAHEVGCALLAQGNAADHVHVLVRYPSTVTVASLVHRLKGASSHAWNLRPRAPRLSWQSGSWAASVGPADLAIVARYVEGQRLHHAERAPLEAWETAARSPPREPGEAGLSGCHAPAFKPGHR